MQKSRRGCKVSRGDVSLLTKFHEQLRGDNAARFYHNGNRNSRGLYSITSLHFPETNGAEASKEPYAA